MKYIRTKENHIFKIEENITDEEINSKKYAMLYQGEEIIKQADTLEELADCFVAVDKNGNLCENPMVAKGHCFKSFCNYYKAKKIDVDCYLAVLTNKGIIFVAKMNEKGELELL